MKLSARNQLKGTVASVHPGVVTTEVVVRLSGGDEVVAVITKESAERLDLRPDATVYAVIKSSDVMIMVD